MAAPETHPLEHIVTIRRLLEHYEQGFAFIKELVQNADDALKESLQPGRLHLQWYNPTADAGFENPLLRGPALIVINNGPFTIRDRNGLMRMGMGSKAGDSDRIGRFGLGMKAVFHVSEAFFFLESEGEQELRELFCPWLPPQYESWAIVDDHQDWSRITNAVKEMAPDFSKWFAVWIPLRRKELVTNDNPIVNAHPGDSETCPGSLIQAFNHQTPSLGEVLIFLRNLERVSFHDGMALHEFIHRRDEKRVSPQTKYYRHDTAENAVLVEGWKTKPAWPKVFEITDTGERSVPDKAKWEASVAISVSKPTGGGSVRLFWNVFLPVGNKPAFEAKLPSLGWNLNVFLHGYFFLSEDRTTVYGADDGFQSASDGDPKGIKIAWNKALATSPNGLLPLIPSALQSAFSGENFSDVQIQEVIACLTGSGWFKIYRKYICQTHSFARLLTNETWAWQHFDSGTARLVFPNFTDLNNESIVSSLLGSSSLDRVVLLENSAALSAGDLKLNWTESDLKWFCESIRQETLKKDAPARKYVTKLLSRLEQIVTSNSQIWHKLPIYEVASINGTSSVVSAKSLQDHASKNVLFSNIEAGLKKSFKDACPNASAWFVVGSAPPGISAQAFDTCAVAAMVLLQASLGGAKNRTDLIGKLLADLEKPKAKSAIRYLIHGNADNRKTDGNLLLRLSGNDGVSKWNTVIETALKQRTETWRLVDATFAIWINDQQKISLNLKMCGADSFRTLCNATDSEVAELPLAPFHDFLVTHLNEGTHYDADADNKLLRRLKIHRYGEDSFTTIEESVWLAPEVGKEPPKELRQDWSRLCQNAKIVSRIQDDTVGLRQRQLFKDRILDSNGIIRLACQQAEPHHFASLILHYLNAGTPTAETSETLKKASWLPLADDKATTLENLLWLEGADDSLAKLVCNRGHDSAMVTRGEIKMRLAEKENTGGWNTMRAHLIPKGDDALELLRTVFGNNPKLHFGLSNLTGSDALGKWLAAVEGCEDDISPAVALIRALWPADQGTDATGKQTWAVKVAAVFAQEWSGAVATRYDTVLEALRDRHRQADSDKQGIIIGVFYSYLSAAVRAGRWETSYRTDTDFTLLNQQGEWTSVSQLMIPIAGIARRSLADGHAVRALGFTNDAEADDALPGAVIAQAIDDEALAGLLREYGADISEQLPAKLWGMLVALLGETPALRKLADELTDNRTETIRDELCGPVSPGINPRQRVSENRYSCEITDGETAEVVALNGDYFDAPLDMDQAAFLVAQSDAKQGQWWLNRFFVNPQMNGVHFAFRLCDPASFAGANSAQMSDRLERTVTQLLQEVLHVTNDRLGKVRPLMEKLMELGQLSLGRAQQEILATAQIHLSQLGIRPQKGSALAHAMSRLDEATSLEAQAREERENKMGDPESNEKAAKKARDEGLGTLRQALQADAEVHRLLSDAMKTRIGREQYVPESIPFELFQNADDALAQLANNQDAPRIFVMEIDNEALRFAHWGRPINHPDEASGELKRSYERDLVKMLILHGSDKQVGDDDAAVTGKFGLGFKSVYLITDNPQVISGDLAFDVAGAIYPRRLEKDPNSRLRDNLDVLMPTRKGGTLIELSTKTGTEALVQRFASMAPYLVVFAREIREIRLQGNMEHFHHWQPKQIKVSEGWEVWLGDAGSVGSLMQIKCGNVCWLFGLDQHGIHRLDDLPCIWATAPLHSTGEVGFAINGPFDPDPGRTELGKGEVAEWRNTELFLEASNGLYVFLKWCVECDDLCRKLDVNHGTPASFWASLWTLFSRLRSSNGEVTATSRVAASVWPKNSDGGYAKAAKAFAIIPNGLPGNLATLTNIDQVRFHTSGYLESRLGQELLAAVADWPEWAEMDAGLRVTAENIVSGEVAVALSRHIAFKTEHFTVPFLIRRLVGPDERVSGALSKRLGQYLNSNVWDSEYNWPQQERKDLEGFLGELKFQNELPTWVAPTTLLISDGGGIEAGRAALALADRRLHQQYSNEEALHFFRLCRGEMRVSVEDLAKWIRQGLANQDEERVTASLRFLASTTDDYASRVAGFLCAETRRSLTEHPVFALLSDENQNRVRGAFQLADMSEARREGIEYSPQGNTPPIHPPPDDDDVTPISLQELVECWNGHEADAVQQFTVSGIYRPLVFPDVASDADLGSLLRETDTIAAKENWYRLLCLGCSMSIPLGRKPEARIISFWRDRLNAEFWAETIPATLEEAKLSGYDQRLDAFFERIIHQSFRDENASGEDADFWRRVFYDFRKMHFYVFRNDLPAVLLQLANANDVEGSALISFLRSGQIPVAMQMPGIESWTGVIGQSMSAPLLFVMRELRRLNVLPPDRFDNACFYMNSPARRVAHRLRWISDEQRRDYSLGNLVSLSERIFDEVSQCEYAEELLPHFDLPLQWYASQNLR